MLNKFYLLNSIGGVIVSILILNYGFDPWSHQIKDYEIGICCFSTEHAALRSRSKDWLAHSQWSDMSYHELLC